MDHHGTDVAQVGAGTDVDPVWVLVGQRPLKSSWRHHPGAKRLMLIFGADGGELLVLGRDAKPVRGPLGISRLIAMIASEVRLGGDGPRPGRTDSQFCGRYADRVVMSTVRGHP